MRKLRLKYLTLDHRADFWQRQKPKPRSSEPRPMHFPRQPLPSMGIIGLASAPFVFLGHYFLPFTFIRLSLGGKKHFSPVDSTHSIHFKIPGALQLREQLLGWTSHRSQGLPCVPLQKDTPTKSCSEGTMAAKEGPAHLPLTTMSHFET